MSGPSSTELWTFWISSCCLWAGLSVFIWRRPSLHRRRAGRIVLTGSILLHTVGLMLAEPQLSDDLWRYLLDGRLVQRGQNPYAVTPQQIIENGPDLFADPGRLTCINNADLVTIYQPTSQLVFGGVMTIYDAAWPGQPSIIAGQRVFRAAFCFFNLVIVWLLLMQLKRLGRSPWWAALYAWHPMVISEIAWSGHQDVIGIAFLLAALQLGQATGRSWFCVVSAGALLALAAGVKPIILPIAIPLAWALREKPLRIVAAAASCVVTLSLLYGSFAVLPGGLWGMLETSRTFMEIWRFNGSLHPLMEGLTASKIAADVIAGSLLIAVLLLATLLQRVPWRASLTYLLAGICLSSTAHPWYLLWALALLPVAWSAAHAVVGPAVWIASLTLPWAYSAWLNMEAEGGYTLNFNTKLSIWVPVYMAILIGPVLYHRAHRVSGPARDATMAR